MREHFKPRTKQYNQSRDKTKQRVYYKDWRKENSDKLREQRHGWGITHAYKLTREGYAALYKAQGGVCAICGNPETAKVRGTTKRLAVDHDHATGKVRGLLCTACNTLLGHARDKIETLEAAIVYLRGSKAQDQREDNSCQAQ